MAHYRYTCGKTCGYGNSQVQVTCDHRSTHIWVLVLGAASTCHNYLWDYSIFIYSIMSFQSSLPEWQLNHWVLSIVAMFPLASTSGKYLPCLVLAVNNAQACSVNSKQEHWPDSWSFPLVSSVDFITPCIVDHFSHTVRFPRPYSFC